MRERTTKGASAAKGACHASRHAPRHGLRHGERSAVSKQAAHALSLRRAGHTYVEIGAALIGLRTGKPVSPWRARQLVYRGLLAEFKAAKSKQPEKDMRHALLCFRLQLTEPFVRKRTDQLRPSRKRTPRGLQATPGPRPHDPAKRAAAQAALVENLRRLGYLD